MALSTKTCVVRIRILADPEGRAALRRLVETACPEGEWRYPDYCYLDLPDPGPQDPLPVPAAATLGGALSRLRSGVRRGGCGLIVASRSPDAATAIARQLPGVSWQSAVHGPGSDRMNLRLFGLL